MTDNTPEPGREPARPTPDNGAAGAREAASQPADQRRRPRRRAVVVGSAVAAAAVAGGGAAWWWESGRDASPGVAQAAQDLAQAWSQGRMGEVDVVADSGEPPGDLAAEYTRLTGALADPPPTVTVASVDTTDVRDGAAVATLDVSFDLAAGHGAPAGSVFAYSTTVRFRNTAQEGASQGSAGGWRPVWEPALVHPALASGGTLALDREQPARADVLGRDGSPVVTETAVVRVGVQPSRTTDAVATADALAAALGIDGAALATRVQQASPDAFVDVITLRRTDYDARKGVLQPIPGAVFADSTLPLAPTRGFARALLGTVGQVTAEVVEDSEGRYASGDHAGLSGLQQRYDERLAGRVGVVVRVAGGAEEDGQDGAAGSTELLRIEAQPGQAVTTSLVPVVQEAADAALSAGPAQAALVAVDVTTGNVVAASNFPADGGDRALTGRFPPGSTFKVVTTLALLTGGLDVEENVPCTPTYTVDGRTFSNFEDEAFGDVPFRTDFARSCNTAFASLSSRLSDDDLPTAAGELGVGADWAPGVDAFAGSVPSAESAVDLAAASFGQGRTLVSPLAMAIAAASVAAGELRRPTVVLDPAPDPPSVPATAADTSALATIGDLMRDVVTSGTATVLAGVPGEPVHAKTGTAEHGTAVPPATHAWTIGYQGNLAFAVFVTEGASGGTVAAPVAADFLGRIAAVGGF